MSWKVGPRKIKMEAGKTYLFCKCGHAKDLPFCDGSHKGTRNFPAKVTVEEDQEFFACCCGQSGTFPRCDESHDCHREES